MVRINNWSSNLDAYRILQEAQSLTEELPHFDTAFPIEPESIAPPEHHNHRYRIGQDEHRVRHLAANRNTCRPLSTCVRAKVEHPFRVIKRQFGYTKVRFRGLVKNTAQMVTLFALSNLWMARRYLLSSAGEVRP
ncbi:hypothetical protein ALO81_200031 [Pseudomonas cannabina]|uniref:Single-stranded DNA-binding protein n=2 Tax=Pseudomonas cannabina TaxID=86840 RepID=A0A0P9N6U8_PSECA|nr:hypothetical protein ALO81_200031 [Pseudomonas cannabina]